MRYSICFALVLCLIQFGCGGSVTTLDPNGLGDPNHLADPNHSTTVDPNAPAPVAAFTIAKSGLKLTVNATAVGNDSYEVRWDWTNDGTWDTEWQSAKTASFTFPAAGSYIVKLEARNPAGSTDTANKQFTISATNQTPQASFVCNVINGMTVSVDASGSSDPEDSVDDLRVRWDWNGDGTWDTEWNTTKSVKYTYPSSGEFTIKLEVQDLNGAKKVATKEVVITPVIIHSSFFTMQSPYTIRSHMRIINQLTNEPVKSTDNPPLTSGHFTIYEDGVKIDPSESDRYLTQNTRPMHLVLVLDYTGSMNDKGYIAKMTASAQSFIQSLSAETHVNLWAFWERQGGFAELIDFTPCTDAGKSALIAALTTFTAPEHGQTEIWNLLRHIIGKKFLPIDDGIIQAIVFLTDGHDTTSKTSVDQTIVKAKDKAISLFPVGLAMSNAEYPKDEPNLQKMALDTNGTYFSVNQIDDLNTVFKQISEDIQCGWTLSYVTPKQTGTHTVKIACDYLGGMTSLTGKFTVKDWMKGDIRKGLLSVCEVAEANGKTEYALVGDYFPRNITQLRFRIQADDGQAEVSLYETDGLCRPSQGWTCTSEGNGWYRIAAPSQFVFGGFGPIARCVVNGSDLPHVMLELPPMNEQIDMYNATAQNDYEKDRKFVFGKSDALVLHVPTVMTGIPSVATTGTPKDASLPSINASSAIKVRGRGISRGDWLVYMRTDVDGYPEVAFVLPSVDTQPNSTEVDYVPTLTVSTYNVYLLDDYRQTKIKLQVVPTMTKFITKTFDGTHYWAEYEGSGFIEGAIKASAGGLLYTDSGPDADDVIDVRLNNQRFRINSLLGNELPVFVTTEGGTSNTAP